jgi:excinuclease UvrABC helicase subunit UvrB
VRWKKQNGAARFSWHTTKNIAEASKHKKKKSKLEEASASSQDIGARMLELEAAMQEAAEALDFEKAIALREEWYTLQKQQSSK